MEITEGNKLIAEFMGRDSDFDEREYMPDAARYHTSWDWQIPVYSKLAKEIKNSKRVLSGDTAEYFKLLDRYEKAVFNNDVMSGFDIIVKELEFLSLEEKATS